MKRIRMLKVCAVAWGLLVAGGVSFAGAVHHTAEGVVVCEEGKANKKKCCRKGFLGLFGKKKCCKKEGESTCGDQAHQQESAPSTQDSEKQKIRQIEKDIKIQAKPIGAPTE